MFFSKKPADATNESTVATLERDDEPLARPPVVIDEAPPVPARKSKKKKDEGDDLEYEWEFETPFGKLELELEPKARKEEKERQKREKQERDAAKQAAKLAKKAERAAKRGAVAAAAGEIVVVKRSNLVPVLVVFAIVVAAVAIAFWLFARPGEEEDEIPPELRSDESLAAAASQPQGPAARIRQALRAGRQASREAQAEQQRRFEEATKQS
ncbi:MAG: hypothetical protein HY873_09275 [Chloroflexi bacterium]|nr:hypothetical protein [Chloroflexota bacterium]